jgi:hypothetical protein
LLVTIEHVRNLRARTYFQQLIDRLARRDCRAVSKDRLSAIFVEARDVTLDDFDARRRSYQ